MNITINQEKFKRALFAAEKIISRNVSLPILNNLLLKTDNGRLKISSTNLEIGINYWVTAKIDEEGQIAIPAKIFSDFVGNVKDEKLNLSSKDTVLSIKSENYKTQIICFDAKDFPIIPKITKEAIISLNPTILKRALLVTSDSIALSETRPELAGVYISFNNSVLEFASTDSFRLTEVVLNLPSKKKIEVILPRNTALELIRLSQEIEDEIKIAIGENQILFYNNDFELISRLIEGRYPDYKKVIPDKFISKALFDKKDFEQNVRLASIFSSTISDIKLKVLDEKTEILAKNVDRGEIVSQIESILKNEPFEISLNYSYLLDGLKNINSDKVILEFTGDGSPLIVRDNEDKNFVYLIMPLRNN